MRIIHWAGDSTVTSWKANRYPMSGIAQAFDRFTVIDVVIYNHAKSDRSTKSFIDQGRLNYIDREMGSISGAEQFLFIQFGHNDGKKDDLRRYTVPDTEFIENLGKFVQVARSHDAIPLFITPTEQKVFLEDQKNLSPSIYKDYVKAYHKAAEMYDVPIIDLCKASRDYMESIGEETSRKLYMYTTPGEFEWLFPKNSEETRSDYLHLRYEGAMKYGELLARSMVALGEPFSSLVAKRIFDSSGFDVGYCFLPKKVV